MKEIRLSLEYMCSSVWLVHPDGGLDDIGPEGIPISSSLKHDITKWNNIYQSTLDQEYPPDSGFSSELADELLWKSIHEEGKSLFKRLKKELSEEYNVTSKKYNH